jgi:hypothetical protein
MHKLFIATYSGDLAQFELCCHCLNKNWLGNQAITISWGQPNPLHTETSDIGSFTNLVKDIFDSSWQVEVVDGAMHGMAGYCEQQVNKVRFSIDPRFQDTIVFDCKDFLLKPTDIDFFKPGDRYRVAYFKNGNTFRQQYVPALDILDHVPDGVPTPFNTTPWIWATAELEKFWTHMQARFGPYQTWKTFPGATEWSNFYIFNYCDAESVMPMTDDEYEFVNFCGIWQTLSLEEIQQQASLFDCWDSMRIWKHTRKDSTPQKVEITEQVLKKYGIEQSVIDRWKTQHLAEISTADYSREF